MVPLVFLFLAPSLAWFIDLWTAPTAALTFFVCFFVFLQPSLQQAIRGLGVENTYAVQF